MDPEKFMFDYNSEFNKMFICIRPILFGGKTIMKINDNCHLYQIAVFTISYIYVT